METLTAIYPGGQITVARSYLEGFATYAELVASPLLYGVRGRGVVLKHLFDQTHPATAESAAEVKKTARKGKEETEAASK